MSQYTGDAQPYEDYEADFLEAMGEKIVLNDTPTSSTPKTKKRAYRRKLTYSPSASVSPKKKSFKPSKKLTLAPKKKAVVIVYSLQLVYHSIYKKK